MSTRLRETMSRDSQGRKEKYQPSNILDTPTPPPGFKYRWVRHSLFNEDHSSNVRKHIQDGWSIVQASDIDPELAKYYASMGEGRYSGAICQKDVLLMIIPEERAAMIREYYDDKADKLVSSVDKEKQNLSSGLGISEGRIEFENKSKSEVSKRPI
jgi:hypothetical protein